MRSNTKCFVAHGHALKGCRASMRLRAVLRPGDQLSDGIPGLTEDCALFFQQSAEALSVVGGTRMRLNRTRHAT